MKRFFIFVLCLILFTQPLFSVTAAETPATTTTYEYLDDGSYFVTTLSVVDARASYTKNATKTTTYYNENDVAIWALHLDGTFLYNYGVSATATNAQASVTVYDSNASVQICDAYTSGSAAFGYATVQYKTTTTYKELSLNCDKYGNIT